MTRSQQRPQVHSSGEFSAKCLVSELSGVASYGTLWHVLPTIPFFVHFRVNMTGNYPTIVQSARVACADVLAKLTNADSRL